MQYQVCRFQPRGKHKGLWLAISGLGKNKDSLDTTHETRRTANRLAAQMRKQYPGELFRVEER